MCLYHKGKTAKEKVSYERGSSDIWTWYAKNGQIYVEATII